MIPWQVPVVTRVIMAHGVHPIILKKVAGDWSRAKGLRLMFFLCMLLSVVMLLVMRPHLTINRYWFLVLGLGSANSFAAYAQWRAVDISLSRTALFTFMDDVIPIILGFVFLGESKILTPLLFVGIVICVSGAISYAVLESKAKAKEDAKRRKTDEPAPRTVSIFIWIGIYSVIWGVAHFAFRAYAISGMPVANFLVAWYGGAFLGSYLVLSITSKNERGASLSRKQIVLVSYLALSAATCLALEYWASMHAPLAVTQPIFQVTEMILPTMLGLFLFKEIKELNGAKKLIFAVTFVGSFMVALGY
jgi:hypothetical protein